MGRNNMSDNPQEQGDYEWTNCMFRMLDDNELFWLSANESYRKMSDTTALNLREQKIVEMNSNDRVYQKEY